MNRVVTVLMLGIVFLLSACQQAEEANTLVVGIECAYAPFDWTTSEENDHTVALFDSDLYCDGYDVDVANHIADELDMDLVIKKIEWTGLIPALQSGVIDVIISAMSPTAERAESVLFSDEYYRVNTVMVVAADGNFVDATSLSDFSGANVIAQQDTIQDDLIDQIDDVNHLLALAQTSELVINLSSGVSDALVTELPVAEAIVEANPSLAIVEFTDGNGFVVDDTLVTVAVAVRLGEEELVGTINDALALLDQDTREQWMDAASDRQPIGE
ncbi:transporter substrate-binding domain-containing protein [Candidatus Xianfuyuplasma coldseepsis]|uniref:Transporter substrate-binding domain-containing protein n=1 Tax=Candidatus Xianfuyuplasma coldseepsis TaxID=2782163 RepID=A0A7L7KST6_9MOLU|nr:transporter substrate-binding domain-containing protein [Xianfuyuplasma coldseepsis]QMS85469.1 transporter substrate-binding domain-containing protein [Xianfuyuplasma coldseepsis]